MITYQEKLARIKDLRGLISSLEKTLPKDSSKIKLNPFGRNQTLSEIQAYKIQIEILTKDVERKNDERD